MDVENTLQKITPSSKNWFPYFNARNQKTILLNIWRYLKNSFGVWIQIQGCFLFYWCSWQRAILCCMIPRESFFWNLGPNSWLRRHCSEAGFTRVQWSSTCQECSRVLGSKMNTVSISNIWIMDFALVSIQTNMKILFTNRKTAVPTLLLRLRWTGWNRKFVASTFIGGGIVGV